jgi:hypothetical protein
MLIDDTGTTEAKVPADNCPALVETEVHPAGPADDWEVGVFERWGKALTCPHG